MTMCPWAVKWHEPGVVRRVLAAVRGRKIKFHEALLLFHLPVS
jgi:hypothetical protein